MIDVEIAHRQSSLAFDAERLAEGVRRVLLQAGVSHATVSVAVVADAEMHALNRRHLNHDYPTDVLSFLFDRDDTSLEGELIVSADTARRTSVRYGWSADDELLLYAIHGALHLVGFDDQTPQDRAAMRQRETSVLAEFGLDASTG